MKQVFFKVLTSAKWMAAMAAILFVGFLVAIWFMFEDPNDAPLWAAWTMGFLGLVLGAVLKRGW